MERGDTVEGGVYGSASCDPTRTRRLPHSQNLFMIILKRSRFSSHNVVVKSSVPDGINRASESKDRSELISDR